MFYHTYHQQLSDSERAICLRLAQIIEQNLPEAEGKIWHGHPVWFLDDNPIVGYSLQKQGIRLMFWSGADFNEPSLSIRGGKFLDASVFVNDLASIQETDLVRCLEKSRHIQWDYKNIVRRKGRLEPVPGKFSLTPVPRQCEVGHWFIKSSDCPVCPDCEKARKVDHGLLAGLAAPARRALEAAGIHSEEALSRYRRNDLLALHGLGPSSLPILEAKLKAKGMDFKGD